MKISFENIENREAVNFLSINNADRDRIAISDADFWVCAKKENGDIVGVIGLLLIGKIARVKGFFVARIYRNQRIGKGLLEKVIIKNKRMTAFATDNSRPIFEKNGFILKKTQKNGIHFMERGIDNV